MGRDPGTQVEQPLIPVVSHGPCANPLSASNSTLYYSLDTVCNLQMCRFIYQKVLQVFSMEFSLVLISSGTLGVSMIALDLDRALPN